MKLCLRDRQDLRSLFHWILLLGIAGGMFTGCQGNSAGLFPSDWNIADPTGPQAQSLKNSSSASVPAAIIGGLQRQSDCSLTYFDFSYSTGPAGVTVTPNSQIPHYEKILHAAANLSTAPDRFPEGCVDSNRGVTSRPFQFLGTGKDGRELVAVPGASGAVTSGLKSDGTYTTPATQATQIPTVSLLSGDLNRDGNTDLIAINSNGSESSVTVFLGIGDGTFQPEVDYVLPGAHAQYGVLDDLNGDGILDLLVSSESPSFAFSIFIGNGDGTFQPARTFTPSDADLHYNVAFTTADVNGDRAKDIVTAQGQIFLGNGDGITYTQIPQAAFPPIPTATNNFAPSIVAADFNHDGIVDLATDDGLTVRTYLGNGNGTFAAGQTYTTIANYGFLTATDLDGDGNVDLWSGYAGNGMYSGDAYLPNVAYALMGNGDGTFRGVSGLPGVGAEGASSAIRPVRDQAASLTLSAPSPSKLSVQAGQTASPFMVTVSSSGTTQTVTFACTGLPALAACSFQPSMVNLTPTVTSSPVSVTITTASSSDAAPGRRILPPSQWLASMRWLACALLALSILLFRAKKRRARWALSGCLLLLLSATLVGCVNNKSTPSNFTGTPPGVYAVTVTANGATIVSTPSAMTLTVTAP